MTEIEKLKRHIEMVKQEEEILKLRQASLTVELNDWARRTSTIQQGDIVEYERSRGWASSQTYRCLALVSDVKGTYPMSDGSDPYVSIKCYRLIQKGTVSQKETTFWTMGTHLKVVGKATNVEFKEMKFGGQRPTPNDLVFGRIPVEWRPV